MGSSLSQQLCCVLCQRCREQEAANAEPSETKPILQSPGGDTRTFLDTQPPTPALKVPSQGSKDLSQHRQPSADGLEENREPSSAAEGWDAAWNPMDFFVAPADEEVEGGVEDLTQQEEAGEAEEGMDDAPDVPVAEQEQPQAPALPGTEGAPCAGPALQEGTIPSLMELSSQAEPGRARGSEPPAATPGVVPGRDSLLRAGQAEPSVPALPAEGTAAPEAAGTSPEAKQRAELPCLVEAMSLLSLRSPAEAAVRGMPELYSASAGSWQPLRPQWGSPEPPRQLLELLQGSRAPAQGSLCFTGLSELLQQPRDGALCELGSRGCTPRPEAEPQPGMVQPALELPEEPAAFVPVLGKQEAEFLHVPPSLPEVLGSSGEIKAENVAA